MSVRGLFSNTTPVMRSKWRIPRIRGEYNLPKHDRHQPGYFHGRPRDADGNILPIPEPINPNDREFSYEKNVLRRNTGPYFRRKAYLTEKIVARFEQAKMVLVVQPYSYQAWDQLKKNCASKFKYKHCTNGYVRLDGKPYEALMGMIKGPIRLLFVDNDEDIQPALKLFFASLKVNPDVLFLGGHVQGTVAVGHEIEKLLDYQDKRAVMGEVLPILNAPASILPVLMNPTMQLTMLLKHHVDTLQKASQ